MHRGSIWAAVLNLLAGRYAMLLNPLSVSCLELLGLLERAQLTPAQRQQVSRLVICEMLPRAPALWSLPAVRQRQLLDQIDQLKADLRRKLPQPKEPALEAATAYPRVPPRSSRSADMRLSGVGGIVPTYSRKTAARPAPA